MFYNSKVLFSEQSHMFPGYSALLLHFAIPAHYPCYLREPKWRHVIADASFFSPWKQQNVSSAQLSASQKFALYQKKKKKSFVVFVLLFYPKPFFSFPPLWHTSNWRAGRHVQSSSNNGGLPRNNGCPLAKLTGELPPLALFYMSSKSGWKREENVIKWIVNRVQLICSLIGCPCVPCEAFRLPSQYFKSSSAPGEAQPFICNLRDKKICMQIACRGRRWSAVKLKTPSSQTSCIRISADNQSKGQPVCVETGGGCVSLRPHTCSHWIFKTASFFKQCRPPLIYHTPTPARGSHTRIPTMGGARRGWRHIRWVMIDAIQARTVCWSPAPGHQLRAW